MRGVDGEDRGGAMAHVGAVSELWVGLGWLPGLSFMGQPSSLPSGQPLTGYYVHPS